MYVQEILPRKTELYSSYVDSISVVRDLQIIGRTLVRIVSPRR